METEKRRVGRVLGMEAGGSGYLLGVMGMFQDLPHSSCCLAVGSSRPLPWAGLTSCARSKGSLHTSKGGADWL